MNRARDRRKLRREYVRQKTISSVLRSMGSALISPAFAFCVSLGLCLFVPISKGQLFGQSKPVSLLIGAGVGAVIGFVFWLVTRAGERAIQKGQELAPRTVIPRFDPASLPADEVLVRGASAPAAPNETMLRATVHSEEEAKSEELLRSHLP